MRKKKIGIIILCVLLVMSGAFWFGSNAIKGLAADGGKVISYSEGSISETKMSKENINRESIAASVMEAPPEWPFSKAECSEMQLIAIAEYVIGKDVTGKYDDSHFPGKTGDELIQAKYVLAWQEYFKDLPHDEPQQVPYFEQLYNEATDEERKQIQSLHPDISIIRWYPRDIMIVTGKMPADTSRLSKKKAIEICQELKSKHFDSKGEAFGYVLQRFNEIAGAPDYYGGSGWFTILYYCNEGEPEEVVCISMLSSIQYEKLVDGKRYSELIYMWEE